jgi:proteasome accessory factor B
VGIAARLWQHAGLAAAASSGLAKLRAAGIEIDPSATLGVEPVVTVDPAFGPLTTAARDRRAVAFDYRVPEGDGPTSRRLQPWGVVCWRGRWYVVGHDRDRDAPRMFRLSRVEGKVGTVGRAGSFAVPEGTDLRALAAGLATDESTAGTATVRARTGHGFALRRSATTVSPVDDAWDRLEVPFGSVETMAELVTSHGADVVVEAPEELRAAVVARLRRLAKEQSR